MDNTLLSTLISDYRCSKSLSLPMFASFDAYFIFITS